MLRYGYISLVLKSQMKVSFSVLVKSFLYPSLEIRILASDILSIMAATHNGGQSRFFCSQSVHVSAPLSANRSPLSSLRASESRHSAAGRGARNAFVRATSQRLAERWRDVSVTCLWTEVVWELYGINLKFIKVSIF